MAKAFFNIDNLDITSIAKETGFTEKTTRKNIEILEMLLSGEFNTNDLVSVGICLDQVKKLTPSDVEEVFEKLEEIGIVKIYERSKTLMDFSIDDIFLYSNSGAQEPGFKSLNKKILFLSKIIKQIKEK